MILSWEVKIVLGVEFVSVLMFLMLVLNVILSNIKIYNVWLVLRLIFFKMLRVKGNIIVVMVVLLINSESFVVVVKR